MRDLEKGCDTGHLQGAARGLTHEPQEEPLGDAARRDALYGEKLRLGGMGPQLPKKDFYTVWLLGKERMGCIIELSASWAEMISELSNYLP